MRDECGGCGTDSLHDESLHEFGDHFNADTALFHFGSQVNTCRCHQTGIELNKTVSTKSTLSRGQLLKMKNDECVEKRKHTKHKIV